MYSIGARCMNFKGFYSFFILLFVVVIHMCEQYVLTLISEKTDFSQYGKMYFFKMTLLRFVPSIYLETQPLSYC